MWGPEFKPFWDHWAINPWLGGVKNGPFWTKNGQTWQACQRSKVVQKGPKRTKIVNPSVFGHLRPFRAHLDFFGPFQTKINFLLRSTSAKAYFVHLGQTIHFCLKWSNRVQIGPKWPKIVNNTYVDHLGPFWTLSDHFGTLASLVSKMIVKMRAGLLQMPSLRALLNVGSTGFWAKEPLGLACLCQYLHGVWLSDWDGR